jgi:hypothetical protein
MPWISKEGHVAFSKRWILTITISILIIKDGLGDFNATTGAFSDSLKLYNSTIPIPPALTTFDILEPSSQ